MYSYSAPCVCGHTKLVHQDSFGNPTECVKDVCPCPEFCLELEKASDYR